MLFTSSTFIFAKVGYSVLCQVVASRVYVIFAKTCGVSCNLDATFTFEFVTVPDLFDPPYTSLILPPFTKTLVVSTLASRPPPKQ